MGVRQFSSYASADTALVTTAETVIATLAGVSTNQPGQTVALRGEAQITTGANTTAVTLRVRRDSLTGALVGEANAAQVSAAAGSTEDHSVYVEEVAPGEFSGRTYVLTAQQTAASANGAAVQASLVAQVTP
jgi:hypothetical protein